MSKVTIPFEEMLVDPVAALGRARRESWLADTGLATGVLRWEDVRALLADPRLHEGFVRFMTTLGVTSGPFFEWMSRSPLNLDGETHLRWRAVLSRTFTPRRVEGIRPFLRDTAHALVDGFAARGRCDFMAEYGDQYPSLGLCELIGVPHEDRDRFRGWADAIGLGFSPIDMAMRIAEIDDALSNLLAYAGDLAARRRMEPRDDLVTQIAHAGDEAGWDDEQVRGAIAGLVFAGHETTKNQLGWMIATLAERPDAWDGVASGALAPAAVVEEVLRLRPAVSGVGRVVAEAVERSGERFEPETQLFFSILSANRDERVYPKPDEFDPAANSASPHLAFGFGAHHCLGAALARAELQESLAALAARIGCPRLAPGATWRPPVGIHGPTRLPIEFEERR